jgi:predicted alpha/beta superfamily hydrolase
MLKNHGARSHSQRPSSAPARLHKHEDFVSRLVDDHHDLLVYLPPMYEAEGERRFPVLYMQDGQNLFDPETSFIKGNYWRMGETADALIEAGAIEPLIIVGIYNAGVGGSMSTRRSKTSGWAAGRRMPMAACWSKS